MTFTLIARCGRCIGTAVATALPGGAAKVAAVVPGHGAIAAQALANPFWIPYASRMLNEGADAAAVVAKLASADPLRAVRQLLVMDARGAFGGYTGANCQPFAGHACESDHAVAGNILAGPEVLTEMSRVYALRSDLDFGSRMLAALTAGHDAGGDRRGLRSACVNVDGRSTTVDDSDNPIAELARTLTVPTFLAPGGLLSNRGPALLG